MKLNKNSLKQNENKNLIGIIEIEKKLISEECGNTTNKKKWKRNCPKCNKELFYKDKYILNVSKKKNVVCGTCSHRGKVRQLVQKYENVCSVCGKKVLYKHKLKSVTRGRWRCQKCKRKFDVDGNEYKRNCPGCKKEIKYEDKRSRIRAEENRSKCGRCTQLGKSHPIPYRKPHSEETKRKLRLAHLQRIKNTKLNGGQMIPNYNRTACEYFDWLNKWNGWNGKHAMNGGEVFLDKLGFWIDYYDPQLNLVIEWDEQKHYTANGVLKKKDRKRMYSIKRFLGCKFFRMNDKTKELKEW